MAVWKACVTEFSEFLEARSERQAADLSAHGRQEVRTSAPMAVWKACITEFSEFLKAISERQAADFSAHGRLEGLRYRILRVPGGNI